MFDYISSIAAVIALWAGVSLTLIFKTLVVLLALLFLTPVGHFFIAFFVICFICKQIEG